MASTSHMTISNLLLIKTMLAPVLPLTCFSNLIGYFLLAFSACYANNVRVESWVLWIIRLRFAQAFFSIQFAFLKRLHKLILKSGKICSLLAIKILTKKNNEKIMSLSKDNYFVLCIDTSALWYVFCLIVYFFATFSEVSCDF